MNKVEQLNTLIEQLGRELDESYEIQSTCGGNLILICDIEAEYDEAFYLFETTEIHEAINFLIKNKMFKREDVKHEIH